MLPQLKRKIGSFLLNEEGKIGRHGLLTLGSIISSATIPLLLSHDANAEHVNRISVSGDPSSIDVSHGHHQSHSSHGSHSSHSSSISSTTVAGDDGDSGGCGGGGGGGCGSDSGGCGGGGCGGCAGGAGF